MYNYGHKPSFWWIITGSSGFNPEYVDYDICFFILAYKLG
jgi:hypothetical protein